MKVEKRFKNLNINEKYLYDYNIIYNKYKIIDWNLFTDIANQKLNYIWRNYILYKERYSRNNHINLKLRYGYSDLVIKQRQRETSIRCIEYWLKKGYSEEEAKQKIYNLQKRNFSNESKDKIRYKNIIQYFIDEYGEELGKIKFKEKNKYKAITIENLKRKYGEELGKIKFKEYINKLSKSLNKESLIKNKYKTAENYKKFKSNVSPRCIEYWLKKGYSEEEAKIQLSEFQSTFSYKSCIEKYGIEKGIDTFEKRQDKFINSWLNKSIKEIKLIREKQSINGGPGFYSLKLFEKNPNIKNNKAVIYLAKVNCDGSLKVGITQRDYKKRYNNKIRKYELEFINEYESDLYTIVSIELYIKDKYKDYRINNTFSATECYNIEKLNEIESYIKEKINENNQN